MARATATSASSLSFHVELAVFHNMIFSDCDYGMENGKEWAVVPKKGTKKYENEGKPISKSKQRFHY